MRIEKLDSGKIKVTLTAADLDSLDIDINHLAPDSRELHNFLFNIMETIKEETGFNPYTGQVVVEATASANGISLLVSKVNVKNNKVTKTQFDKATAINAKLKNPSETEIFYFDNFDDLCFALKEVNIKSLMAGSLYRLNNTYCFTIINKFEHSLCINIMSEFSAKKSAYPLQISYIREHGKPVAKGNELVNMVENIRQLT